MPVLIYERVKIGQYLHFIRRYRAKLVFAGNLNVLGILLTGFTGYLYVSGTKYHSSVHEGLLSIMATAKLDDRVYRIVDWFQKRGRLIIYVTKELGR